MESISFSKLLENSATSINKEKRRENPAFFKSPQIYTVK